MALAEICGLKSYVNFNKTQENDDPESEFNIGNFSNNLQLAVPPYANPVEKLAQFNDNSNTIGKGIKIQFDHGTTTLGFVYKNGIILAVDSRATGGNYIGSQSVEKIIEINDYLLATMAGGAADCVYWDRVLAKQCRMYELRNRELISIAAASKLMSNMVYNYKGMGLSIGMMIAGWDKRGPSLYYVDSEGTRTAGKVFSVGSGSLFAYGVLDSLYDWNLDDETAYELGRRSIYHATYRDAASGGIVRVYHVKQNGWVRISAQDCKELHYKYADEKLQAQGPS